MSSINKGTPNEGTRNVSEEDVVEFYTNVFHNPEGKGLKAADAMKAAEFFTKYYNMLDKEGDNSGTVVIVDDIGSVKDE